MDGAGAADLYILGMETQGNIVHMNKYKQSFYLCGVPFVRGRSHGIAILSGQICNCSAQQKWLSDFGGTQVHVDVA